MTSQLGHPAVVGQKETIEKHWDGTIFEHNNVIVKIYQSFFASVTCTCALSHPNLYLELSVLIL